VVKRENYKGDLAKKKKGRKSAEVLIFRAEPGEDSRPEDKSRRRGFVELKARLTSSLQSSEQGGLAAENWATGGEDLRGWFPFYKDRANAWWGIHKRERKLDTGKITPRMGLKKATEITEGKNENQRNSP